MNGPSSEYVEQCIDELRTAVEVRDTHLAAVTILDIADDYPEFAANLLDGILGQGVDHIADQLFSYELAHEMDLIVSDE